MRRQQFTAGLGPAAAWPVLAREYQPSTPVVGFVATEPADVSAGFAAAFGLDGTSYVKRRHVMRE
jgi:hypothetical protein